MRNKETKNLFEDDNRPNDLLRKQFYSSIGNAEEDNDYQKKKEELTILNRRILEEIADLEEDMEAVQSSTKTLDTLSNNSRRKNFLRHLEIRQAERIIEDTLQEFLVSSDNR